MKEDKVVEAHGTFYTSHCMKCRKDYTLEWMKGMLTFCYYLFKLLSLVPIDEHIAVLSNLLFVMYAVYVCDVVFCG